MDCIKSRTNYIEYESIQLLNIENIVTKIRHHITTIGYKRDELEELKNQRILIFFK